MKLSRFTCNPCDKWTSSHLLLRWSLHGAWYIDWRTQPTLDLSRSTWIPVKFHQHKKCFTCREQYKVFTTRACNSNFVQGSYNLSTWHDILETWPNASHGLWFSLTWPTTISPTSDFNDIIHGIPLTWSLEFH